MTNDEELLEMLVLPLDEATAAFQRLYVRERLEVYGGKQGAAAKSMGKHRNTLSRLIKRLEPKCQA